MFKGKKAVRSKPAFHRYQQILCPLQHLEEPITNPYSKHLHPTQPAYLLFPQANTDKSIPRHTQRIKHLEKQYNIKNEKYPEIKYFCVQGENNHTILVSMKQDLRLFAVKVLSVGYCKLKKKNPTARQKENVIEALPTE